MAPRLRDELAGEHAALAATLAAAATRADAPTLVSTAAEAIKPLDAYLWARATLWSRGATVTREPSAGLAAVGSAGAGSDSGSQPVASKLLVLAPFFDLFNHSVFVGAGDSHRIVRDDSGTEALRAVATRSYAPGEQVHISYGQHSNRQLLLSYGFVTHGGQDNMSGKAATASDASGVSGSGNGFDSVELVMGLPVASADELEALRAAPDATALDGGDGTDGAKTWRELRAPAAEDWEARARAAEEAAEGGGEPPPPLEFEVVHTLHARRPLTEGLLGMARVRALASAAPGGALDSAAARAAGDVAFERRALPPRDEVAALGTVLSVLEGVLASYGTSAEEVRPSCSRTRERMLCAARCHAKWWIQAQCESL